MTWTTLMQLAVRLRFVVFSTRPKFQITITIYDDITDTTNNNENENIKTEYSSYTQSKKKKTAISWEHQQTNKSAT